MSKALHNKKTTILVLGFGHHHRAASTIYRIAQYESKFNEMGVTFEYIPKQEIGFKTISAARNADIVINQKCLINTVLGRMIASVSKRLILDLDDSVWARPDRAYHPWTLWRIESRLRWWVKSSDQVIVANSYLGNHIKQFSSHISVVPGSLDLKLWSPVRNKQKSSTDIIIGWAGSPVSFSYLESIAPVLRKALECNSNLRLMIYSGKKPNLNMPFDYVPFERGTEHLFVRKLDIGLLPLANDESSRGKSPMKAVQYLACGVPVVGNVVGATADILNSKNSFAVENNEQWLKAISDLANDTALRAKMSIAARQMAEESFDFNKIGEKLIRLILN
jgi:glycosyltransferase involved in cell wall biosynthesis